MSNVSAKPDSETHEDRDKQPFEEPESPADLGFGGLEGGLGSFQF